MSPLTKGATLLRDFFLPYFVSLAIGVGGAMVGANIAVARLTAELGALQSGVTEIKVNLLEIQRDLKLNDISDARRGEQIMALKETQSVTADQQIRIFERLRTLEVTRGH